MTTETEGAADAVTEDATLVDQDAPEAEGQGAETQTVEDGEAEQPKPKKTVKERIDELTAEKHAAKRDADRKAEEAEYWRQQALQRQDPTPKAQAQPEEDKEPNAADYTHGDLDAAYIRDHATFHANKAFEQRMREQDAKRAAEQAQSAWQAKEAAVQTKYPDYQEKVYNGARNAWPCTPDMNQAIQESDVGPDLVYHLASNPAEARRIAALSPHSQIRELGKLEASLSSTPQAQPKTVTSAPDPGTTLRGQIGATTSRPDDRQSMDDWLAARNRQLGG